MAQRFLSRLCVVHQGSVTLQVRHGRGHVAIALAYRGWQPQVLGLYVKAANPGLVAAAYKMLAVGDSGMGLGLHVALHWIAMRHSWNHYHCHSQVHIDMHVWAPVRF